VRGAPPPPYARSSAAPRRARSPASFTTSPSLRAGTSFPHEEAAVAVAAEAEQQRLADQAMARDAGCGLPGVSRPVEEFKRFINDFTKASIVYEGSAARFSGVTEIMAKEIDTRLTAKAGGNASAAAAFRPFQTLLHTAFRNTFNNVRAVI
jgi:hypothetical protein